MPQLQAIGDALQRIIERDPSEVFLIEGHTDAVGSDLANLALSDRRAESVAEILTYYYDIPPENLVTQGYGEEYLEGSDRGAGAREPPRYHAPDQAAAGRREPPVTPTSFA